MKINGYIWREDIVDKLWWKHNVDIEEVEEVFANRPYVGKIAKGHYKGEDVYIAFGQTELHLVKQIWKKKIKQTAIFYPMNLKRLKNCPLFGRRMM